MLEQPCSTPSPLAVSLEKRSNDCRGPPSLGSGSELTGTLFLGDAAGGASREGLAPRRARVSVPSAGSGKGTKPVQYKGMLNWFTPASDLILSCHLRYLWLFVAWGLGLEEGSGMGAPSCWV